MYNTKSTQNSPYTSIRNTKIFLNFCYFLFLLLLISCQSDAQKKENDKNTDSTIKTTTSNINSTSKRIVVFGDSLTAGYGLEDVNDAFPGVLQTKINSLDLDYVVVNSGVSGETTAGGKNRINWVLSDKPDIFILELGGNDGLRGVPLSETKANLQFMIDAIKTKYPDCKILLAGMQIPPNLGQDYTNEFKSIFPELANKNQIGLIPFLLENVGGIAALNQPDGIHPTKAGHKILADNTWQFLKPLL